MRALPSLVQLPFLIAILGCAGAGGGLAIEGVTPAGTVGLESQSVTFSGLINDADAVAIYSWNFGGGATPNASNEDAPEVTLGAAGTYQGRLVVTGFEGPTNQDALFFEFTVTPRTGPPEITAVSAVPLPIPAESTVTFRASVLGVAEEFDWRFGGGVTPASSDDEDAVLTTTVPGLYQGSLTVSNDEGSSAPFTFEYEVVDPALVEGLRIEPSGLIGDPTDTVRFQLLSEEPLTDHVWTFSGGLDRGSAAEESPTLTCVSAGEYTVSVTALNASEQERTASASFRIDAAGLPLWQDLAATQSAAGVRCSAPRLAPDGSGGAWIAWIETAPLSGDYAIKLAHQGALDTLAQVPAAFQTATLFESSVAPVLPFAVALAPVGSQALVGFYDQFDNSFRTAQVAAGATPADTLLVESNLDLPVGLFGLSADVAMLSDIPLLTYWRREANQLELRVATLQGGAWSTPYTVVTLDELATRGEASLAPTGGPDGRAALALMDDGALEIALATSLTALPASAADWSTHSLLHPAAGGARVVLRDTPTGYAVAFHDGAGLGFGRSLNAFPQASNEWATHTVRASVLIGPDLPAFDLTRFAGDRFAIALPASALELGTVATVLLAGPTPPEGGADWTQYTCLPVPAGQVLAGRGTVGLIALGGQLHGVWTTPPDGSDQTGVHLKRALGLYPSN